MSGDVVLSFTCVEGSTVNVHGCQVVWEGYHCWFLGRELYIRCCFLRGLFVSTGLTWEREGAGRKGVGREKRKGRVLQAAWVELLGVQVCLGWNERWKSLVFPRQKDPAMRIFLEGSGSLAHRNTSKPQHIVRGCCGDQEMHLPSTISWLDPITKSTWPTM